MDVKVKRGANVDSNPQLATADFKLKLRSKEGKNMTMKKSM